MRISQSNATCNKLQFQFNTIMIILFGSLNSISISFLALSIIKITDMLGQRVRLSVVKMHVSWHCPNLTTLAKSNDFTTHAVTSWQLISHAFSKSQTPKKYGAVRSVPKLDISR